MTPFREQIAADNAAVFINDLEFAAEHDLNGNVCKAILQDISVADDVDGKNIVTYGGVYGSRLQVNCLKSSLPKTPVSGNAFTVDGKLYLVESCADDMGIYTIQLVVNKR